MKRILLTFSILFGSFLVTAQLADKAKHVEAADFIKKEYNSQNYKAIHKALDKEFQKQMNEKELADFFKFNVFDTYGAILNHEYSEYKNGLHTFLMVCKNGSLDLTLGCNTDGKISAMEWTPHKVAEINVPVLKNDKYNTDNPKASAWDLKVDSIVKDYMSTPTNCGISIAVYQNKKVK